MKVVHVRNGKDAARERQLRALERRYNDVDDYMTETWWDMGNCDKRFPEYQHLTQKQQAAFRERKLQGAQDEIARLESKLRIKGTELFNKVRASKREQGQ